MPKPIFSNDEQKQQEWDFAIAQLTNPDGTIKPNGTKLRRKDHPNEITHSFMVFDNQILVVSRESLGDGDFGSVKLAANKEGKLYAPKKWIFKQSTNTFETGISAWKRESQIAQDLNIEGELTSRNTLSQTHNAKIKCYMAYHYLGISFFEFIDNQQLNDRDIWSLTFQTLLPIYRLNHGKASKTGKKYSHDDMHVGNVVIDRKTQRVSLVDYGKSSERNYVVDNDCRGMLLNKGPGLRSLIEGLLGHYETQVLSPGKHDHTLKELREKYKGRFDIDSKPNITLYFKKEDNKCIAPLEID